MGFLSGVGKILSSAWAGVKKVVSGPIGQTLLGIAGSAFGPLGSMAANVVGGLIANKGKLNFGSILSAGLSAFGPLAGKLGSVVQNLPSALKNPLGLVQGLLGNTSLGDLAGSLLKNLSPKINDILGKVTGFLGKGISIGDSANNVLNTVNGVLGNFNINAGFLTDLSEKITKITGALQGFTDIIGGLQNVLNGGLGGQEMIRA